MKILSRVLVVVLALVLVIALAAGGAFFYFTRQSFPQTSGALKQVHPHRRLASRRGARGRATSA
jgi:hypothetical protein